MLARRPAVVVLLLLAAASVGVCAPAEDAEAADTAPYAGATEAAGAGAEPVLTNEEPCLGSGGRCLPADECPQGGLSQTRGLCPTQSSRGVECCYGLSVKERRCSARGGICRPKQKCGRALWEEKAEDCPADETCCILIS